MSRHDKPPTTRNYFVDHHDDRIESSQPLPSQPQMHKNAGSHVFDHVKPYQTIVDQ
jgi:hypothetical protein